MEREPVKDAPALLGTIVARRLDDFYRSKNRDRVRVKNVDFSAIENEAAPAETGEERDEPWTRFADSVVDAITVPPLDFEDIEFRHDIDLAVRDLDDEDRDAFILTELRGLTVREASDVLGIPKSTVQDRAEAARTYIAKELTA